MCFGSVLTIGLVSNYYVLMFLRMANGIGNSFVCIFCPVWIDQFSPKSSSSIIMAANNLSSIIGTILGFVMTSLINKTNLSWNFSYLIQAFIIGGGLIMILLTKNKYFDRRLTRISDTSKFYIKDEDNIQETSKYNKDDLTYSRRESNEIYTSKKLNEIELANQTINYDKDLNVNDKLFKKGNTKKTSNLSIKEAANIEFEDMGNKKMKKNRNKSNQLLINEDKIKIKQLISKKISYTFVFKTLIKNSVSFFNLIVYNIFKLIIQLL